MLIFVMSVYNSISYFGLCLPSFMVDQLEYDHLLEGLGVK